VTTGSIRIQFKDVLERIKFRNSTVLEHQNHNSPTAYRPMGYAERETSSRAEILASQLPNSRLLSNASPLNKETIMKPIDLIRLTGSTWVIIFNA